MKRNKQIPVRKEKRIGNTLYSDYTAEVFAAGFVENGLPLEQIRLIREGWSKSQCSKEVDRVVWEYSEEDLIDYLTFHVHKKDIYDTIPQGLFHHPSFLEQKRGKTGILNSIRKGREEEFNARYFFKPFEISIDNLLVKLQLYERRLEWKHKYSDFIRIFASQWKSLKKFPLDKSLFLLALLFNSYRITDVALIADILGVLLECSVEMKLRHKTLSHLSDSPQWRLGKGRLGLDTVIGGSIGIQVPNLEIHFYDLPFRHKDLLFSKSEIRKQLSDMLDLFIPADTELELTFTPLLEEAHFCLSAEPDNRPILGFNTKFILTNSPS
ncbi:Uncharacterised protein [Porphyromonas macacae]|uniref:Type VI secretion protein, VC_A0111 family n=1 Tax=Porphyromonas macacae TaxID=28115 RepID=A0A379E9G2_9PORP|nr:hypothetical protein [Porphyromonas macacae]SUB89318.1 Uncharacterised protein [Porphyromonas macacae]